MKHINDPLIVELLTKGARAPKDIVNKILEKSRELKRLSLEESAILLSQNDPETIKKIFNAALEVKEKIYGRRIVLFAPLYISSFCANNCLYCAFRAENKEIERKALTIEEIKSQVEWLLKRGHKRILMVAGEAAPFGNKTIDYYVDAIKAIYEVKVGSHRIKRVNINCAPLAVDEFKKLKAAGIGTFQIFQETYHDSTYHIVHPKGPKSDPDNRLDSIDRAFAAGIDDVGIGVLYGLYDHRFETLAMLMHIEYLEKTFKVGPHTISVPRIEPAVGSELSKKAPYKVSDEEFKKIVAILRLSVPYTGLILSTRETAEMRDELINLGVSQMSAESRTEPGGYVEGSNKEGQFTLSDERTLDDVIKSLVEHRFIPSFCAACYRKERTGEAFMELAKPGNIKTMCQLNALVTLKEYLIDFASEEVKRSGDKLIQEERAKIKESDRGRLDGLLGKVSKGERDLYV